MQLNKVSYFFDIVCIRHPRSQGFLPSHTDRTYLKEKAPWDRGCVHEAFVKRDDFIYISKEFTNEYRSHFLI